MFIIITYIFIGSFFVYFISLKQRLTPPGYCASLSLKSVLCYKKSDDPIPTDTFRNPTEFFSPMTPRHEMSAPKPQKFRNDEPIAVFRFQWFSKKRKCSHFFFLSKYGAG